VAWWSSWLTRWRSRVDLEKTCRLGPMYEWLQPGIEHGRPSIIVSVASRSGGLVCGGQGIKVGLHLPELDLKCRQLGW